MQISPTDPPDAVLLRFDGGGWLLIEQGGVAARGGAEEEIAVAPGMRAALAVPGEEVAIHWLELAEGLAPAQAAAAARLMLADASAHALADMHLAVGRAEGGLTPAALVPLARMRDWVAGDPDLIVPSPLLLAPPAAGYACHEAGRATPDYRGPGAAFSVEPELAALLIGDAPVAHVDEAGFEAGLAAALFPPVLNLRQGAFARRRQWKVDTARARRIAWLALGLALLTLALQVASIMRYTFDADRIEAETAAIAARAPAGGDSRPGFSPPASLLFGAIRAVPNVELVRMDYRPDGTLAAIVTVDGPATLAMLRRQLEAGGLSVENGAAQAGGARPSAELLLRPA